MKVKFVQMPDHRARDCQRVRVILGKLPTNSKGSGWTLFTIAEATKFVGQLNREIAKAVLDQNAKR